MFGAVGLYRGDIFFAIISDGTLYFKVDDTNRGEYVSRHMPRFRPYRIGNRAMSPRRPSSPKRASAARKKVIKRSR
jgi:TfoX/Sxy family transcriptional regulator of competence genes